MGGDACGLVVLAAVRKDEQVSEDKTVSRGLLGSLFYFLPPDS